MTHSSIPIAYLATLQDALTDWTATRTSSAPVPDPSEAFLSRARQAARSARNLRSLAAAASALSFRAMPLPDFLSAAARVARLNLGRLLSPGQAEDLPAAPWIRLAKSIGMNRERIGLLTRLWIAERQGSFDELSSTLARGGARPVAGGEDGMLTDLDEVAATQALDRLESEYDAESCALLASCLSEIEK